MEANPPPATSAREPAPSTARSSSIATGAPIDLAIDVTLDSESHFFADLSGDLSHGGIFVATYRDIAVGTAITVVCSVGDDEIALPGVVAWQRDAGRESAPGVGVVWSALGEPCLDVIVRFCQMRAPLYYEVELVAA